MANELQPGTYHDIPNEDYHSWRWAIGSSGLKAMRRGAAYYYGQYLDPNCPPKVERESAGRLFGNITHCALFEPHKLNSAFLVGPCEPDGSPMNKNKKAWQEFKAGCEAAGATAITREDLQAAIRVREACMADPEIARWFTPETWRGEVTVIATDPETGVKCKIRCDLLHTVNADAREVVILDGKSYNSVDDGEFSRQIARMDYDLQTAFYVAVATWAGYRVLAHMYLAFEDEYPHQPRLFELDRDALENGQRKYRRALNYYARCRDTGRWPTLGGGGIATISLPSYAMEYDV